MSFILKFYITLNKIHSFSLLRHKRINSHVSLVIFTCLSMGKKMQTKNVFDRIQYYYSIFNTDIAISTQKTVAGEYHVQWLIIIMFIHSAANVYDSWVVS